MRIALADFQRQADPVERLARPRQPLCPGAFARQFEGSSTDDMIVMRGFSAAFGSWKMI